MTERPLSQIEYEYLNNVNVNCAVNEIVKWLEKDVIQPDIIFDVADYALQLYHKLKREQKLQGKAGE